MIYGEFFTWLGWPKKLIADVHCFAIEFMEGEYNFSDKK